MTRHKLPFHNLPLLASIPIFIKVAIVSRQNYAWQVAELYSNQSPLNVPGDPIFILFVALAIVSSVVVLTSLIDTNL